MRWIGCRVLDEAKRIIGIFAYLAVVFGILVLHEFVVLSRHEIDYSFYGFAFLNVRLSKRDECALRFRRLPMILSAIAVGADAPIHPYSQIENRLAHAVRPVQALELS